MTREQELETALFRILSWARSTWKCGDCVVYEPPNVHRSYNKPVHQKDCGFLEDMNEAYRLLGREECCQEGHDFEEDWATYTVRPRL